MSRGFSKSRLRMERSGKNMEGKKRKEKEMEEKGMPGKKRERKRKWKSRRAYGSRKILGNVFSRPIPVCFRHFWACLAALQLTCFRKKRGSGIGMEKMNVADGRPRGGCRKPNRAKQKYLK